VRREEENLYSLIQRDCARVALKKMSFYQGMNAERDSVNGYRTGAKDQENEVLLGVPTILMSAA